MNIILCCTPLHVLLAALESPQYEDVETLYFIIKDAPGIEVLATSLLSSPKSRFVVLQGAASLLPRDQISQRKNNVRIIRAEVADLSPDRIFIFFDQIAEAQSLINFKYRTQPRVIWLEDGITTYSVATPFSNPIVRLLINKVRFDPKWGGSKWLGQHPAIQEIGCFYPKLLRTSINKKKAKPISRTLEKKHLESFEKMYGPPQVRPTHWCHRGSTS